MRPSFSRPRQCWDNAVAESFFSTLKTELIHRRAWQTVAEVKTGPLEVRTVVTRVGRSSFDLGQELHQAGRLVGRGRTVLVRKDFAAVRAVPLEAHQRAALAVHAG